jgi:hypothetical protein
MRTPAAVIATATIEVVNVRNAAAESTVADCGHRATSVRELRRTEIAAIEGTAPYTKA